jgi:hypothetical protein
MKSVPSILDYTTYSLEQIAASPPSQFTGLNLDIHGTIASPARAVATLKNLTQSVMELVVRTSPQHAGLVLFSHHISPENVRPSTITDPRQYWSTLDAPTDMTPNLTLNCRAIWEHASQSDDAIATLLTSIAQYDPRQLHLTGDIALPVLALIAFWFWQSVDTLTIDGENMSL